MIIFNIATVHRRKEMFLKVLQSLSEQTVPCDKINVAMSYPKYDPEILVFLKEKFKDVHIKWVPGMTAESKMYAMDGEDAQHSGGAYFLTMDDDIIYPAGYCEEMINGIDKYHLQAVVGFHGIRFDRFPVQNYKAQKTMYQYFKHVEDDIDVHVIGTGCLGFWTQTLIDKGFHFPTINKKLNCLDGSFGRWCRDNKVRTVVLAHKPDWIKIYPESQDMQSLWKLSWKERYKTKLSFLDQ